ncbi:MAG: putative porin [Gammaproteobacteria bacterium]|nr:putative porin [Gammaproteobacteria bacterium]MDH3375134.1 putative porin [Gammaproteobacteria bacterium]
MKRKLLLLIAINVFAFSTALGAVSDEDFEQLRRQLATMSQRLDEIAAENAELRRSQAETATTVADVQTSVAKVRAADTPAAESWSDRVRLDGDFRYRYENIDAEGSSERNRNRIRARANIRADLSDDVEVGFGLSTGSDDPVSANQTLGDGGSSKGVVLNLAYVDWEVTDGLHLMGGKFNNPLMRVGKQQLLWDGDWTPEGLALTYKRDWFFANAIGTYLESDSSKGNSNFSWGGQLGASGEIGGAEVMGGIGYYSIKTKGEGTTFGDSADAGDYFGNTAVEAGGLPCGSTPDTSCTYLYDYLLTEVFAEASFDLGDWPTVVFLDYVNNSDPSDNDTGWAVGTRIGQTKDRGQVEFAYLYADKEADSVLGLLTDSDFAGGGTDNKGHLLQVNYGISKSWSIGAQYFINEADISSGSKSDYNRLMLDTQWKWK